MHRVTPRRLGSGCLVLIGLCLISGIVGRLIGDDSAAPTRTLTPPATAASAGTPAPPTLYGRVPNPPLRPTPVPPTPTPDPLAYPSMPPDLPRATVLSAVDGDTLKVQLGTAVETVRLIGIDTPETRDPRRPVECFGREAAAETARRAPPGATVALQADPTQGDRDRYGRLLRYVWLPAEGRLLNLELLIGGFAVEYTYALPYQYQAVFQKAAKDARDRGWGLWAATTCQGDPDRPAEDGRVPTPPQDGRVPNPPLRPTPAPQRAAPPAPAPRQGCHPSYPDVCIPPPPPDLDCGDVAARGFRVLPPDPHRFDGNHDGIGCER